MEKPLLRLFGLLGTAFFIPLFLFTFLDVHSIERAASSFISWKLESSTTQHIDNLQLPGPTKLEALLGERAAALRAETERQLETVKQQLKDDLPSVLADEIAKLKNLDCECRKKWQESLKRSMELELINLEVIKNKLINFSHAKYMEIVTNLTLDVRIFLGANSVVFLFLLLISFLKPVAIKHLFLPGSLLFVSTAICSYFYLFEQNWFYTILYNDYTGFGYLAYLLIVFAVLCDIVFNKARVTTEIINGLLNAIGQVGSLSPC